MTQTKRLIVLIGHWKQAATDAAFRNHLPPRSAAEIADSTRDLQFGPTSVSFWSDIMGGGWDWAYSASNFWERGTYGHLRPFIVVHDVGTIPLNQIDYWYSSKGDERQEIIDGFRRHVQDSVKQLSLAKFDQIIAAPHPGPTNTGAKGHPGDAVLTLANQLNVIQHEVGHVLGFDHPWGLNHDGAILEYHDPYCVMGFSGPGVHRVAPTASAPANLPSDFWQSQQRPAVASVYQWIPSFRTSSHVQSLAASGHAELRAAAEDADGLAHLLVIPIIDGQLMVEYRPNARPVVPHQVYLDDFDDSALPSTSVVVHSQHVRSTSPYEDGSVRNVDDHIVWEGAMQATVGAELRLHGHTLRITGATPAAVTVECEPWSLQSQFGGVRFDSSSLRMDAVIRDADDLAVRTWTAFTGWTPSWQHLLPAGGDIALTSGYPNPSVLVGIGRDGRPLVSRFGALSGGGWMYLGGRDDNGIVVHDNPPKFANSALIAAAQMAGTHVALVVDDDGSLYACTMNTLHGPQREGRWHRVASPPLSTNYKPTIACDGPNFHCVAHTADGRLIHAEFQSNAYNMFVDAKDLTTTWSDWTTIDANMPFGVPVTLVFNGQGLWLACIDAMAHVRLAERSGQSWSALHDLGGEFTPGGTVGLTSRTSGQADVFAVNTSGQTLMAHVSPGASGSVWASIDGFVLPAQAAAHVHAVSRSADHLELMIDQERQRPVSAWWSPATGWQWFWL